MDKKEKVNNSAEYLVGNTKYTTVPVFGDAVPKEAIEDKIRRLILQDKEIKHAKP